MDQQHAIAQATLPEIHQKYIAYRLSLINKSEETVVNANKNAFYAILDSYQQYFEYNTSGYSLFNYLILYQDIEAISVVLKKLNKLDLLPNVAQSILEDAIATNNIDLLKLLVRHGLNIDQVDSSRSTQLALAAARCDIELCSKLLDCGANIKFVNTISRKSILELAFESTEPDIIEKTECINFLLAWYLAKDFEPMLSRINITNEIAKNIFLFGATKNGEPITKDTHLQFIYAYKDHHHFIAEMEKSAASKDVNYVNQLKSLDRAITKCLQIDPRNKTLITLTQYLKNYLEQKLPNSDTTTIPGAQASTNDHALISYKKP